MLIPYSFIENGRIEDTPDFPMKTGLRALAQLNKGEFRLTGNQHLIISNIDDADLTTVKDLLVKYKLDNVSFSGLRLSSSACVAFPTCGLAMAESERYLPKLIDHLESTLEENGLRHDSIVMRMTGCPNGCARPWLAEVAFVGKAYGAYNSMFLPLSLPKSYCLPDSLITAFLLSLLPSSITHHLLFLFCCNPSNHL